MMTNVSKFNHHQVVLKELDRPCAPPLTLDQNFKMTDHEEDCSGEIYSSGSAETKGK